MVTSILLTLGLFSSSVYSVAVRNDDTTNATLTSRGLVKPWTVTDLYQGANFFDGWDFFTDADPTHGLINYQSRENAKAKQLISYLDNKAVIAVDDYTWIQQGHNRDSVRISSKKHYNAGTLIIADFAQMPQGCGVWPAFWTVGPAWPTKGEIDVLEMTHDKGLNQYHLHTSDGCSLDRNQPMQGQVLTTGCASGPANNDGCGVQDKDPRSYGDGFNGAGGGVYAMYWGTDSIKMWHWAHGEIPGDIQAKQPNTGSWPTPAATFAAGASCDISKHFADHVLVLNTAICGDWAGATYQSAGCPGTCADHITDPRNFALAKWHINYIAVYN
ncbi:glycoside hydrolase family 16 protein [Mycena latifolia]|nr:glycoside hydrolase family 16 protein [Mycena latifolia]